MSTAKTRISKKSLASFPVSIANQIKEIKTRFKVASFTYYEQKEGQDFYFDEGAKVWAFYGEDERSISMIDSNTVGGNGCYQIGSTISPKAGTTILEVSYLGKYYLSIYNYDAVEPELNPKDNEQWHSFELKDSFSQYTIDTYSIKKRYNTTDLRECLIIACDRSIAWDNKPFYVCASGNGYCISETLEPSNGNFKVYKLIGNQVYLGEPKFETERQKTRIGLDTTGNATSAPVPTVEPHTGQFELFQTEDRQLTLF